MADVAAITQQLLVVYFPESAVTIWTRKSRNLPQPFDIGDELGAFHLLLCNSGFDFYLIRHRKVFLPLGSLLREPGKQRRDLPQRYGVIHLNVLHNTHGHTWERGFQRILDDGDAAALLDSAHADRAVVARSCQ